MHDGPSSVELVPSATQWTTGAGSRSNGVREPWVASSLGKKARAGAFGAASAGIGRRGSGRRARHASGGILAG
ncbi:TPA: glycosyltransferase [Pseudomonas aeruginosa]|nr:glycosyltransferase [Pseudomonas aeruginosa]HBP5430877.1 glycosyltransferase [Pseudomonas aeruginosa]